MQCYVWPTFDEPQRHRNRQQNGPVTARNGRRNTRGGGGHATNRVADRLYKATNRPFRGNVSSLMFGRADLLILRHLRWRLCFKAMGGLRWYRRKMHRGRRAMYKEREWDTDQTKYYTGSWTGSRPRSLSLTHTHPLSLLTLYVYTDFNSKTPET